ncbi:histone deacetylase 8-like isoform X2 [Rhopilema esculentum]|uniref:histone deacetylase 8-like isoform X2 n=1 Tax=Rhopilema esculentum TaxID=499914 RepID=UPI0031E3D0A6
MAKKDVVYIHSDDFLFTCEHPVKALMVHRLIEAYRILGKLRVITPQPACIDHISLFHSKEYISCTKNIQEMLAAGKFSHEEGLAEFEENFSGLEDHGLAYDCQPFKDMYSYICFVAGAALKSAEILNNKDASTVINFYGGWHHAHRDSAAGFCYVNDIVLAILKLREKYKRVLYIDLDIHHGDGVEEAFFTTDKVMTVSLHRFDKGYFPGTGSVEDVGYGIGKYYSVNVPLKEGIDDEQYYYIFTRVMHKVKEVFDPDVVVCQCGADCLSGDPLGGFNLTNKGLTQSVKYIANWNLPLLILGGGGYNFANTARTWAYLTASILDEEICRDIPEHEMYAEYSPLFDINITPSVRRSCNSEEYIDGIIESVSDNLSNIPKRNPLKMIQHERNEVSSEREAKAKTSGLKVLLTTGAAKRQWRGKRQFIDENKLYIVEQCSGKSDKDCNNSKMPAGQISSIVSNAHGLVGQMSESTDVITVKRQKYTLVDSLFEFDEYT